MTRALLETPPQCESGETLDPQDWDEIRAQARAHAGEVEHGGGLYAPHRPSWDKTVVVTDANEIAKEKRWGSAVSDAAPSDGST